MLNYIKVFEEYQESPTWNTVRDTIQTKKPFIIIAFKNKDSYKKAISDDLREFNIIKQTALISNDGKLKKYYSVFFKLNDDSDYSSNIPKLYEKYKIKKIIYGKNGKDFSTLYSEDGTSSDFGNEIVSELSPSGSSTDSLFKIGSVYYKFINFSA
jgi:hypothetical protein